MGELLAACKGIAAGCNPPNATAEAREGEGEGREGEGEGREGGPTPTVECCNGLTISDLLLHLLDLRIWHLVVLDKAVEGFVGVGGIILDVCCLEPLA